MSVTAEFINQEIGDIWPASAFRCDEVSSVHARASCVLSAGNLRPGNLVSGPKQFEIADCALWYLVFGVIDRIEVMSVTSELSIRFLRPCTGEVLNAEATLDKGGKRSIVGTIRVWTDDNRANPSATAQGTYVVPIAR
ncbi:MAG: PaaI family thioesterase [Pseudomonadota bacterium]